MKDAQKTSPSHLADGRLSLVTTDLRDAAFIIFERYTKNRYKQSKALHSSFSSPPVIAYERDREVFILEDLLSAT